MLGGRGSPVKQIHQNLEHLAASEAHEPAHLQSRRSRSRPPRLSLPRPSRSSVLWGERSSKRRLWWGTSSSGAWIEQREEPPPQYRRLLAETVGLRCQPEIAGRCWVKNEEASDLRTVQRGFLKSDVVDEPHAIATMVALSTENAIRQAARMNGPSPPEEFAPPQPSEDSLRVRGPRLPLPQTEGKRAMKMWLRPCACTAIGAKGQKHMGEPGRPCLLCAAEHMRPGAYAPGERLNRRCGRRAFARLSPRRRRSQRQRGDPDGQHGLAQRGRGRTKEAVRRCSLPTQEGQDRALRFVRQSGAHRRHLEEAARCRVAVDSHRPAGHARVAC